VNNLLGIFCLLIINQVIKCISLLFIEEIGIMTKKNLALLLFLSFLITIFASQISVVGEVFSQTG